MPHLLIFWNYFSVWGRELMCQFCALLAKDDHEQAEVILFMY
jgi:hypothetical protein